MQGIGHTRAVDTMLDGVFFVRGHSDGMSSGFFLGANFEKNPVGFPFFCHVAHPCVLFKLRNQSNPHGSLHPSSSRTGVWAVLGNYVSSKVQFPDRHLLFLVLVRVPLGVKIKLGVVTLIFHETCRVPGIAPEVPIPVNPAVRLPAP